MTHPATALDISNLRVLLICRLQKRCLKLLLNAPWLALKSNTYKPSGVTNAKGLADAPNGAYVPGNPDDVFTVRTDKGSDINVAFTALQRIEQRLAASFMLVEMRDAERVTAEEVDHSVANRDSLGNVYAILTSEFQAPYIRRKLELHMRQANMERLPGPCPTNGQRGLVCRGRGNDLEKTARFIQILQQALGPDGMAQYINNPELIRRLRLNGHLASRTCEDRTTNSC